MIHIPDTPEGVMLPGALFPVIMGQCAGSLSFLRTLGIEEREEQERFCRGFCGHGCYPFCCQEAVAIRAKHIQHDRIPLFLECEGRGDMHITGIESVRKVPKYLLDRSVYSMEAVE